MFIDEIKINVKGGNGGNGSVSFLREKYFPNGGPDGGNGGKGGSVILEGSQEINTLSFFGRRIHFSAQKGANGSSRRKAGKDGKDTIVQVPLGTVVYNEESGRVIGDITRHGQQLVVAKGGRGGRGNECFATPNYKAPKFAENGEIVTDRWIRLELRLIAHAGLIGFPNAGKSTLLSQISSAKPKIAPYPFTTLTPNLGAVKTVKGKSYVFADIPGLIEGAHKGKGLGDKFLKHISRTKMLVHVIDLTQVDPNAATHNYYIIMKELSGYNVSLAKLPVIVAANKVDVIGTEEAFFALRQELEAEGIKCFAISALTGEGVEELLEEALQIIDRQRTDVPEFLPQDDDEEKDFVVINEETEGIKKKPFTIEKVQDYYVVHGRDTERMVQMLDLENDEAVKHLQDRLKRMGVEDELERMGIKQGAFVVIGDYEFNYYKDIEISC